MRRSRWIVLGAVVLAMGLCLSDGASAAVRSVKSCTIRGGLETCSAAAQVKDPQALFVKVLSQPHQRASVFWQEVCTRNGLSVYKTGRFAGPTPLLRKIAMPYAAPDSCKFSAQGHLFSSGFLKVVLQARTA